jgi:hypothetical protein
MDEALLTLVFAAFALILIIIRIGLPLALIVIGLIQMRKGKKGGKTTLIIGSIYMLISVAIFIYSGVKYGF